MIDWPAACKHLSQVEAPLAILIQRYDGERLQPSDDGFRTLANAIVGQQISVKAASAIWARLRVAASGPSPEGVAALSDQSLRACGLSLRKVEYLRGLAKAFSQGGVLSTSAWREQDDHLVLKTLTSLHGIGRWTAHMFLIFHLCRPDILPVDDIGLLRSAALGLGWPLNDGWKTIASRLQEHAEVWRPYRTVATWYWWRENDPEPVIY